MMGGDAFGIPAARLSPTAFATLCAHITTSLTESDIAIPPSLAKESHGDVDVLVSTSLTGLKGRAVGGPTVVGNLGQLEEKGDVDGVCAALCARLGGGRWSRNGRIVSVAVPLALTSSPPPTSSSLFASNACNASDTSTTNDASKADASDAAFHQIDLILIPSRSLLWAQMSMTYGQTRQLLKVLTRAAAGTSRLRLHDTYLGYNTPQPAFKPRREIELCVDPVQLCDWLGIGAYDPSRFHDPNPHTPSAEATMSNKEQKEREGGMERLFAWLGSAPQESLARKGYAKLIQQWREGTLPRQVAGMGDPGSKRQRKLAREDRVVDGFCAWLAGRYGRELGEEDGKDGKEAESDGEMSAVRFFGKVETYLATLET